MLNFQPPEEDSQTSSEYDDEIDAGAQVLNNLKNYDENEELPENNFEMDNEPPQQLFQRNNNIQDLNQD